MAVGDLLTAPGMVELRGLALGTSTYRITALNLFASPEVRTFDQPRSSTGVQGGFDLLGGRAVTVTVSIAPGGSILANQAALETAWQPSGNDELQLAWRLDGTKWLYFGQARGAESRNEFGLVTECRFFATDPRAFSVTEHTDTLDTTASTITNAGTKESSWRIEIHGPCTGPRIRRMDDSSNLIDFDGLTVPSGQTLIVSSRRGTATLNGVDVTGSAKNAGGGLANIAGIQLPVGNSDFRVNVDSGSVDADIYWRDAR